MSAFQQREKQSVRARQRTTGGEADREDGTEPKRVCDLSPNRIANWLFTELCKYERDSDDECWYKESLQWYEAHIKAVESGSGETQGQV